MDTIWLLLLGLLPLLTWVSRSFNEWRHCHPHLISKNGGKLPPGHMGWPIIGELWDFLWYFKFIYKPDEFIWKRKARYGDTGIYRTHLFGSPSIITCSPETNRFVMGTGTENGSFIAGWPAPKLLGEKSLIMVEGMHHKRMRRAVMEAINRPQSLQNIFIRLQPAFKEAFQNWSTKGTINTADEMRALTFSNICSLLLSFQRGPMLGNMEMMYRGLLAGLRAQPINIPGTAFHYALKCRRKLSAIVRSEIHEREAHRGSAKTDFLQDLMDSVDSNGDKLSEEEISDTITTLLLGGYESTAGTMTWALYYLCKYPKVLCKLKEENYTILKEKGEDKLLSYDDVRKMKYTSKVIDEVIRLANTSQFLFRTVAKDTEFNGYKFPKGWKVIMWLRSIHVDHHYFKNPLEFNPDRWEGFKPKPSVYNVFGTGPRICPGNNFAKMGLFMFLHYVSIDYKWELINPHEAIKFLPTPRLTNGAKLKFSHI